MDDIRTQNALIALEGLSVGDAFGESCSYGYQTARIKISQGNMPPGPYWYTDDTELALAICDVLFPMI